MNLRTYFRLRPQIVALHLIVVCLLTSGLPLAARAQAQGQSQDQNKVKEALNRATTRQLQDALRARMATGQEPKVAWDVLPAKIVRDNYGHYVSSKYIAIDITVHNTNTSDQIIVRAFTFGPASGDPYKNADPNLVRGSILKGQDTGARNTMVRLIKVLGNLATGSAGFVKNVGASASYGRAVSIFSDPFEKGVEMVFPDTTVDYLTAWDKDEVFKNGFIVDPGKEVTGRIFIPVRIACEMAELHPSECREGGWLQSATYDPVTLRRGLGKIGILGNHVSITVNQSIQ
jgi:hypothetical protein